MDPPGTQRNLLLLSLHEGDTQQDRSLEQKNSLFYSRENLLVSAARCVSTSSTDISSDLAPSSLPAWLSSRVDQVPS
eukprot:752405-Hanusia_phi.AAC.6